MFAGRVKFFSQLTYFANSCASTQRKPKGSKSPTALLSEANLSPVPTEGILLFPPQLFLTLYQFCVIPWQRVTWLTGSNPSYTSSGVSPQGPWHTHLPLLRLCDDDLPWLEGGSGGGRLLPLLLPLYLHGGWLLRQSEVVLDRLCRGHCLAYFLLYHRKRKGSKEVSQTNPLKFFPWYPVVSPNHSLSLQSPSASRRGVTAPPSTAAAMSMGCLMHHVWC